MNNRTIAFHTLGCKLNFSETSEIARGLKAAGYIGVGFDGKADVYVINTCTVTGTAESKCRQAIRKAIRQNPDAVIAVIGCFTEVNAGSVKNIEGVNIVLGNEEKFRLADYLNEIQHKKDAFLETGRINEQASFHPAYSAGDRTRSFFKIQDGCDYFCSYCNVPFARGRSRSGTIAETMKTAHEIDESGIKEMILTGVNTGDFGRKNGEKFIDLLKELDQLTNIQRIRISSIEPELLSDEIISFVAVSEKFLPHFHIPLQSGSDRILKMMKRRYDTALFSGRLEKIKKLMPHCCVAVDIITGFPGETEELSEETCHYLDHSEISYAHIFPYSVRPGTHAALATDKVPQKMISERSRLLHELSEKKKDAFYRQNRGTRRKVLFESQKHGNCMHGFTDNYIKVKTDFNQTLVNEIREVKLDRIEGSIYVV